MNDECVCVECRERKQWATWTTTEKAQYLAGVCTFLIYSFADKFLHILAFVTMLVVLQEHGTTNDLMLMGVAVMVLIWAGCCVFKPKGG